MLRMNFRFLASPAAWMLLPVLTKMKMLEEGRAGQGDDEFSFEHAAFHTPVRYSGGDVKQAVEYMGLLTLPTIHTRLPLKSPSVYRLFRFLVLENTGLHTSSNLFTRCLWKKA